MRVNRRTAKPLLLPDGKPYDLRERTLMLAVRILGIAAALPSTPEGSVVRQQLARCGCSVGANVEEADGALTAPDKRKSFVISRKEARELRFWLRVIERRWPSQPPVDGEIQETTEILRILSTIIAKLG